MSVSRLKCVFVGHLVGPERVQFVAMPWPVEHWLGSPPWLWWSARQCVRCGATWDAQSCDVWDDVAEFPAQVWILGWLTQWETGRLRHWGIEPEAEDSRPVWMSGPKVRGCDSRW